MKPDQFIDELWSYAAEVPMEQHPWFDGIIKHLGIALRSRDASLVACSSKDELDRVRESWCKKKLALTESDDDLDQMIKDHYFMFLTDGSSRVLQTQWLTDHDIL